MSTSKTKSKGGKASQVTNGTSDHKNQPTAEQLRIASMAADKSDVDPEMLKKIKEVSDLTGRSADEAYTALHDCNGDANRAVDLLFEKDNHQDEWHEMKKKRKPAASKVQAEAAQSQAVERSGDWESSEGQTEAGRGRRDRGPPRYGRGTGRGAGRGSMNGANSSRERVGDKFGNSERPFDASRGRRRGAGAGRPGGRNFRERDQPVESAHQNIELWSNSIAENGKEAESWNNNDEWTNADAWDGSLEEGLVLTRSVPPANHQSSSSAAGGNFASNNVAPGNEATHHLPQQTGYQRNEASSNQQQQSQHYSHQLQQPGQQQQQSVTYNLGDVQHLSQPHHHQQQQQNKDLGLASNTRGYNVMNSLGQGMSDSYSTQVPNSSAVYLSHYAKEATECIKNAVGIGSSPSTGRTMGGAPLNATPMVQQLDRSKPQQHQQQHQQQQQQLLKQKVPSKIPQSAVEMPGSMGSMQLDVQFGNWDAPNNAGLLASSNQPELNKEKQPVNLQQFMTGNLPPTVSSLSKLHMQNPHDSNSIHLKATVEDMMSSARSAEERRLHGPVQAPTESTGAGGNSLPGGNPGYPTSAAGEATTGKVSFPSPNDDRKSHTFTQQASTGYGQMQSSSATQMEKSLLTSTFQNQAASQGMGLGSLGLSSSLNSTPPTTSVSQTSTASVGGHSSQMPDLPQSASNPQQQHQQQQHHHHLTNNAQLQYPYNLVRGADGATSNSTPYMYNHQFSSKNYSGDKQQQQPSSSLVFDGAANAASNLYHQSSYHMPSSAYPGSSSMYLGGGGGSYVPSSNVGSFHNSGSGAYQSGNLGSGENPSQAQPPFHHHHPSSSSNYPSTSLPGDGVFHNQSGHLFRNTSYRSPMEQESFQREGSGGGSNQPSSSMGSGITAAASNKLASDLGKLGLKDGSGAGAPSSVASTGGAGGNQFDQGSSMISVASLTTATNTTSSANLSTSVTSTSPSVGMTKSSNSQLSLNAKSATQTTSAKHMMNYQNNVNLLNTNYMISQPPGFQLAPFGYQHSQQALTGYAYEDMQAQHFNVGGSYVDIPFQMTNALQGRSGQQMSAQSQTFGGSDTKLTPLEPSQPGGSLQPQQPATGSANQQFHPYSSFNYYIPGTGLMPYIPVMPMSGMAVPMPTNPALQASVPSSQYQQKPGAYGSQHAFNMGGGQSQDFGKGFNQSQTTLAKSANGNSQASSHGDMLLASGSGFSKQHVQGFDKSGFHGGTPPSSFGLNVPGGTQTGTPGAGPAIYSGPFMPVMGHPSHSQILHHTMVAQEMSLGNRGGSSGQQKVGPNKSYNPAYWSSGN